MPRKFRVPLPPLQPRSESVGQRIARLRKAQGLTQAQLAQKIGISHTLVSDYECARLRLNDEMVVRVALALNASADEILGLSADHLAGDQPSLRLMRRIKKIEQLPAAAQKALLRTIDMAIRDTDQ
ncbi:MAG TPA: helix-turn-helix transcriptional regulator [Spirochaetia bacterium]|nr:helix-turn-helix transcriptional regulator [Spirochaetia bacterium]